MNETKGENENTRHKIGSLYDRFIALLVDYGPLALLGSLMGIRGIGEVLGYLALIWLGIAFILIPLRYKGMTLGKKIIGLRVIPHASFIAGLNYKLDFSQFIIREIVKCLIIPLGLLNIIIIVNSKQRRGIHDFMVGSIVVADKPEPLSVKDYM